MPLVKMTLAEAQAKAKPFTAEQKARFAAMAAAGESAPAANPPAIAP